MSNFRQFLEQHVFRKDGERFIMLLYSFIFFMFFIPVLSMELSAGISGKKISFLAVISLLYALLMRKMLVQYVAKHAAFDKKNWSNGWKGKMKVLAKWFDRGE